MPANQRMHQSGRGRGDSTAGHANSSPGRFNDPAATPEVIHGPWTAASDDAPPGFHLALSNSSGGHGPIRHYRPSLLHDTLSTSLLRIALSLSLLTAPRGSSRLAPSATLRR